ncbi:MAG: hypothetical protein HGA38_04705 [Candidatus Moranbacteria bacterium]|nr:hypothetical protein [Candidatus Moranbacteria bacterium]NTW46314.1 hypothetical protein [Candidatus Moranbacteria bacterium]
MSADAKATLPGSILTYVLVIMMVVSILLVSILQYVSSQIRNAQYAVSREQAFQVAEQGIQFYKWYLAHQTDGRTAQQIQAFWDSGTAFGVGSDYVADVSDPSGGVMGTYRLRVTPPQSGSTVVWVESTGEMSRYPGKTRTIRVRFRRPSWSEHTVLANDFMRFGEGTEVYGMIMSNGGVRFDGLAHNVVTSAAVSADDEDHSGGNEHGVHTHVRIPPSSGVSSTPLSSELATQTVRSRQDVFMAGREFPVTSTDFNGVLGDLGYMRSEAQAGRGRYFNSSGSGRRIILKTNGTYDVCTVNDYNSSTNVIINYLKNSGSGTCGSCSGQCLSNYPIVQNGVIFVEDNVWLEGQVSGKRITVTAANLSGGSFAPSVFIPNNVRYTNYDGTDVIGIIGQRDVEIPSNAANTLRIDGALLAQQGRVGMENYGVHRDTITVFGAIATNDRYGFAWTNGTGYENRNLFYDNNLLYYPPPYFPTGTQYRLDLWEEL